MDMQPYAKLWFLGSLNAPFRNPASLVPNGKAAFRQMASQAHSSVGGAVMD